MAAVEIASHNARIVATTIGRAAGGAFETPVRRAAYFPFDRRNPAEIPVLSVTNASSSVTATLTLRTANQAVLAEAPRERVAEVFCNLPVRFSPAIRP